MNTHGVLITGASGFIGRHVVRRFDERGVEVWAWTRNAARTRALFPARVHVVDELTGIPAEAPIEAIVNLAGAPVIGPPWTSRRRQLLIDSRVGTTHAVLSWCAQRAPPPRVLVSASAIGYYGLQKLPAVITDLDPNNPVYDKSNLGHGFRGNFYFDAFVGYRRRLWANRVGATFQLNVRNLQEDGRLQPVAAFPDGTPSAYRIVDPRQFIFTVSFDL